jgi:hypothetical protein
MLLNGDGHFQIISIFFKDAAQSSVIVLILFRWSKCCSFVVGLTSYEQKDGRNHKSTSKWFPLQMQRHKQYNW